MHSAIIVAISAFLAILIPVILLRRAASRSRVVLFAATFTVIIQSVLTGNIVAGFSGAALAVAMLWHPRGWLRGK